MPSTVCTHTRASSIHSSPGQQSTRRRFQGVDASSTRSLAAGRPLWRLHSSAFKGTVSMRIHWLCWYRRQSSRCSAREPDELSDALEVLRCPPAEPAPVGDPVYMAKWLPRENFNFLGRLIAGIALLPGEDTRAIATVLVSSVLRDSSWQDPKQLRVGRRRSAGEIGNLRDLVADAVDQALETLVAARSVGGVDWDRISTRGCHVRFGDACQLARGMGGKKSYASYDAVVTSPPYANALPYIDTDRLTLRAFGMLNGKGQRVAEQRLIGNREINTSDANTLNHRVDQLLASGDGVSSLRAVLRAARQAAQEPSAGFRRQRTPGLLHAYFRDMDMVLAEMAQLLKDGAPAVLVLGDSTITGPDDGVIAVPTTDILIDLAVTHGFELEHDLGKRLTSYGASTTVHQRNAMQGERVLVLRKVLA